MSFLQSTGRSLAMTLVSEFGDETFIMAALLAMRYPRHVVLSGAISALWVMTILSAALGWLAPKLISPQLTHMLATVMFFFFSGKLFWLGWNEESDVDGEIEEMAKELKMDLPGNRSSHASVDDQPEPEVSPVTSLQRLVSTQRVSKHKVSKQDSNTSHETQASEGDDVASLFGRTSEKRKSRRSSSGRSAINSLRTNSSSSHRRESLTDRTNSKRKSKRTSSKRSISTEWSSNIDWTNPELLWNDLGYSMRDVSDKFANLEWVSDTLTKFNLPEVSVEFRDILDKLSDMDWRDPKQLRATVESLVSPIFVETFLLVFFAEIGDRSQISVITLASTYNAVGVSVGAMVGHAICSTVAVVGGALMAKQVSPQTLAFGGSGIFFLFGVLNLL